MGNWIQGWILQSVGDISGDPSDLHGMGVAVWVRVP